MSVHFKSACLVLEDGSTFRGIFDRSRYLCRRRSCIFNRNGRLQPVFDRSFILWTDSCIRLPTHRKPWSPSHAQNAFGIPIDFESEKIQVSAVVIAEACSEPSHYSAERSFSKWLNDENVPGIAGIDTRRLIRTLREEGVMHGKILIEGTRQPIRDEFKVGNPVRLVSPSSPKRYIPENYQLTDRSSTKVGNTAQ